MSAECQGRDDGRCDAKFDAEHELSSRPRPRLLPSLLSDRYRRAYMTSYKHHFDTRRRRKEEDLSRELAANSKLFPGDQVPKDQVFERGWRDGFDGKDTPPKEFSHNDIRTYERGHRMGRQHREYEISDKLRKENRQQHHR